MTHRTRGFYLAVAIAFLTATPVLANGSVTVFMPHLTFKEETQHPTRAATNALPSCLSGIEKSKVCSVEASRATGTKTIKGK